LFLITFTQIYAKNTTMKIPFFTFLCCVSFIGILQGQTLVNPVIKGFGTIGDAPMAAEKPDPNMVYNIVVDVATGDEDKSQVFFALNNLARLMNLHVMGGVPPEQLNVVVAIHGSAIWSVMNDQAYTKRYGIANPHSPLFEELLAQGVKIAVCSQSMFKRKIMPEGLAPGLEMATSALSVLTTYQLKGYALLKF
jgi:intracellular sulfur oxidation DsrE/DsrF family protein